MTVVLFTASRYLKPDNAAHVALVQRLLTEATAGQPGPHTLREGGAAGGDTIARTLADGWGWTVDTREADWSAPCRDTCRPGHRRQRRDGTEYCPAAGNYRNQDMVDAGADAGVAVPLRGAANRGTKDCYRRARRAGIHMEMGWAE